MVTVDDGAVLRAFSTGRRSHLPPMVLLHGGPGLWDYLAPLAAFTTMLPSPSVRFAAWLS